MTTTKKHEEVFVDGIQVKVGDKLKGKKSGRIYTVEVNQGYFLEAIAFDCFNENGIPSYWYARWNELEWI